MSFFRFKEEDIINTKIVAFPSYDVRLYGDQVTGSIYLEKQFLESSLIGRTFRGWSTAEGGLVEKTGPFTASVDIVDAEQGATNKQLYGSILELYDYYSLINSDYTSDFTGSTTTRFRVMTVPEIYYDKQIRTGSFFATDEDSNGDSRELYDNGRGGIFSGSVSGTLVGNIFYSEGLIVFKGGGLNNEADSNDFGESGPGNFKWRTTFEGVHNIPVKIFRCRAPAGQLNASTNSTFYHIPSGSADRYRYEKEIVLDTPNTYITKVGLYNKHYELVGVASLSQPVKKEEQQDILFRVKIDF